ncbi:unnamed protein product, partial [marine sediment metagenome]
CFIDKFLISKLKQSLIDFFFGNEQEELIKICSSILKEDPESANQNFFQVIDNVYIQQNCLLNKIEDSKFQKEFKSRIQALKNGEYIEAILPNHINEDDVHEIKIIGEKAKASIRGIKKFSDFIPFYKKLSLKLDIS